MLENNLLNNDKVVLITGAAKRIGAFLADYLHERGYNIALHYRHSKAAAGTLQKQLNQRRPDSCLCIAGDLSEPETWQGLSQRVASWRQRLDLLVNNASSFYPTPAAEANIEQWHDLFGSNAQAPYFLTQQLTPLLEKQQGNVVNIIDALVDQPQTGYSLYAMAKSALKTQTLALAKELAPNIRVNAIAPGAILWPEQTTYDAQQQQNILANIPMGRQGSPLDIAQALWFLAEQAPYITGQIIAVDGGHSL